MLLNFGVEGQWRSLNIWSGRGGGGCTSIISLFHRPTQFYHQFTSHNFLNNSQLYRRAFGKVEGGEVSHPLHRTALWEGSLNKLCIYKFYSLKRCTLHTVKQSSGNWESLALVPIILNKLFGPSIFFL